MPCPLCEKRSDADPLLVPPREGEGPDRELTWCDPCKVYYVRDYAYPDYVNWSAKHFNFGGPRFDGFQYHLGLIHRHVLPPGTMLDVGAAAGYATRNARSNGWEAVGFEPWAELADWGSKHMQVDVSKEMPGGAGQFDVITSSDVIEHIPESREFLEKLFELQAPGGLAFLTTPNAGSIPAQEDPRNWSPMRNTLHCVLFTVEGLCGALTRMGWRVIEHFVACGPNHDEMIHVIARKPGACRVRETPSSWLRALGAAEDPKRAVALHECLGLGTGPMVSHADPQRLDRLEAKLQNLERKVGSRSIEAESLCLRDLQGRVRAVFGTETDGAVQLQLFDADGSPRWRTGLLDDGTPLTTLIDSEGVSRLGMVLDEAGRPNVGFYDPAGQVRGLITLQDDQTLQSVGIDQQSAEANATPAAEASPGNGRTSSVEKR